MRSQDEVAAMQCPVCRVPLAMSDREGIEIDYCPKCRGVWLDRGELDKIVERSSAPQPAPPPPAVGGAWSGGQDRDRDYGHGGYRKPHKRKSWLEDIFD